MRNGMLLIVATFIALQIHAQNSISSVASSSTMSVLGTSTLHDWESTVEEFSVSGMLNGNSLKDVRFTAEVMSIKSGKSGMDKNTYNAMKADKYPDISFASESMMIDGSSLKGAGELTIAGVTRTKTLEMTVESWVEGSYMVTGSIAFNMSEFGIEPPKAMMGTIKTGDEVTIKFEINMESK